MKTDQRPIVFVHTDHSPDEVRIFYEVPDELARLVQPTDTALTFTQCLAALVSPPKPEGHPE